MDVISVVQMVIDTLLADPRLALGTLLGLSAAWIFRGQLTTASVQYANDNPDTIKTLAMYALLVLGGFYAGRRLGATVGSTPGEVLQFIWGVIPL